MAATTKKPVLKSYGQQPIDHLFADYRVLRVMSRGSLGTLHVAEDITTGAVILLRVLPRKLSSVPKIRDTLQQDLSKLEKVDHRNVTRVQARGTHDGRLFYVLDFPSSVTLVDYIRERGPLRGERRRQEQCRAVQLGGFPESASQLPPTPLRASRQAVPLSHLDAIRPLPRVR